MAEPTHLDDSLYSLTPDELEFYQKWTGITDEVELKKHVLEVQAQAYKIFPYPCIRRFSFVKLRIQCHPSYKHALEYVQTHPDAVYLELGCCFGNEARKVMLDGYPAQNIIATDLRRDFWELGFELFKDDPSKFPASFIRGDILSSKLLDTSAEKLDTRSDLSKAKSLTELLGYVSAIHAASFFHLFSEEDQLKVARGCASLLTGLSGATVFGAHIGAPKPGLYQRSNGKPMFCHSPESWEDMWKEAINITGKNTEVRVWAKLIEVGDDPLFSGGRGYMVWGVELV